MKISQVKAGTEVNVWLIRAADFPPDFQRLRGLGKSLRAVEVRGPHEDDDFVQVGGS